MQPVMRVPTITDIVDPILGASYEHYDCWGLVRYILKAGFHLDIVADPRQAAEQVCEVWQRDDPRDPFQLLQPWDWLIFITRARLPVTNHVGLVVDPTQMVHTRRRTGVVREPMQRWMPKVFQVARLRVLL